MPAQKIITNLDLDSNEFVKKFLLSLDEVDGVSINMSSLGGRVEEVNNLGFVLLNSRLSQRKFCQACNGYHYYFVRDFEPEEEKDKTGLCTRCGALLVALTMFEGSKDEIVKWMKSKGQYNPYELLKDAIEKMIKEKKITVTSKEVDRGQYNET